MARLAPAEKGRVSHLSARNSKCLLTMEKVQGVSRY